MRAMTQTEAEDRYDPETVRKATALATRLEEERYATLSAADVDALAAELDIAPDVMRRALQIVRETEAREARQSERIQPRRLHRGVALLLAVPLGCLGLSFGWILMGRGAPEAAATVVPVASMEIPPPRQGVLGPSGVTNGSFEQAPEPGTLLRQGSRSLKGWTIHHDSVTVTRNPARPGDRCLFLGNMGMVRQMIPLEVGRTYSVRFDMMGRPGSERRIQKAILRVNDSEQEFSSFTSAVGEGPAGWTRHEIRFEAREPGTVLSLGAGYPYPEPGLLVDNVEAAPVAE